MMVAFLEKGILLVLRVPIAREEMRLPERKKALSLTSVKQK
jgi:hypothetical protein